MYDENAPRGSWPFRKVIKVYPDSQKNLRQVLLRTKTQTLKRPIVNCVDENEKVKGLMSRSKKIIRITDYYKLLQINDFLLTNTYVLLVFVLLLRFE